MEDDIIIDSVLNGCPHCGAHPFVRVSTYDDVNYITGGVKYLRKYLFRPECPECGATIRAYPTYKEAVAAWNRRCSDG